MNCTKVGVSENGHSHIHRVNDVDKPVHLEVP